MRLDVFLKRSRLVKRRQLAKELCDDGAVSLNGRQARSGKSVAIGDRLSLRFWSRHVEIEIVRIPDRAMSSAESRSFYSVLSERRIEEF